MNNPIESSARAGIPFRRSANPTQAMVFVHGLFDAGEVWTDVLDRMVLPDAEYVTFDLPGMGALAEAPGPFTLDSFAADVGSVVDRLEKPFVIVGHGLGALLAERVAGDRKASAAGLVLISPLFSAGISYNLRELWRNSGTAQGTLRLREFLSANLSDPWMTRLVEVGSNVEAGTALDLADAWFAGSATRERSAFRGKVLIIQGAADPMTIEHDAMRVAARFEAPTVIRMAGAGHWLHVEQAPETTRLITAFASGLSWPGSRKRGL